MLYVHIPYCHHKCTYCGFYSVAGGKDRDLYVEALCKELRLRSAGTPVRTVYFGGGTPSVLTLSQLGAIVAAVGDCCDLSGLEEATVEANPENLTPEYLEGLSRMGFFDRLSIGVQSFVDDDLRAINRVHDSRQARQAIRHAAAAGFENISIDLIMGLPGQSVESWRANLDELSRLVAEGVVKHVSCYELTVEPGSILERQIAMGRVVMCGGETVEEQYNMLVEWCDGNGFEQYEVSNFARPGYRSRHNSRYWNRTPYVGVGPGAHSFDGVRRRWNIGDVARYIEGSRCGEFPHDEELLGPRDAYNEYVMTALRTSDGIKKKMVEEPYRQSLADGMARFVAAGLVVEESDGYRPTRRGMLHADGIAASLFV